MARGYDELLEYDNSLYAVVVVYVSEIRELWNKAARSLAGLQWNRTFVPFSKHRSLLKLA